MRISRILSLIVLTAMSAAITIGQTPTLRWYKGNTHTHTLNSDGESSPEDVVKWYRDAGYNFLFVTDHEFITPVTPLNEKFGKDGSFLVIQGQEITDRLNKKPYHVTALNIPAVIMPQNGATVVENLQKNIDLVRAGGGVPIINHPNFGWALACDDIKPGESVRMARQKVDAVLREASARRDALAAECADFEKRIAEAKGRIATLMGA